MNKRSLSKILKAHILWLSGEGGSVADLTGCDLQEADLTGADLTRANLSGADLTRANLSGAYLTGAKGFASAIKAKAAA